MKKNNLGNIIALVIILIIFFWPVIDAIFAEIDITNPNDYARITNMDYKAVVVDEPDSEGKIVVTERITFDVHAASRENGFWELWRDLCESWTDGVKVHYKVNSVKQILPDGREVVWEESPKLYWDDYDYVSWNTTYGPGKWYHSEGPYSEYLRQYECLLFYVDDLYREEITFEIEYEMYNAVLRYNDCSDLYIAMYSGDTTKYLESFNAEILIPNKDMPREGNYSLTTYGTKANNFPVEESATKNPGYYTFSFDLTEDELKFRPYNEFIEFDLVAYGEDKHIFAEHASVNHYTYDDVLSEIYASQEEYLNTAETYRSAKIVVCVICVLIAAIVIFGGIKKIADLKKRCQPYTSDQELQQYRDIPSDLDPNFAAELVFCKDKKKKDDAGVYSAILLSLARKEYIEIKEISASDVMIYINEDESIGLNNGNTCNEPESNRSLKSFYSTDPIAQYTAYGVGKMPELVEESKSNGSGESLTSFAFFEPHERLTTCEKYYLDLIKRHAVGGSISMNVLKNRISTDYSYMHGFVDNMKLAIINIGISLGYLQKANWQEPKKRLSSSATTSFVFGAIFSVLANIISYQTRLDLAFGGFFILGIACLINGLYLKLQANKYVLLTKYGEEEYKKWRGLYNFLKSDTLMNERTVVELPLWEKYLVYSTAFGISEKVIAAMKIRCPEFETERERKSIVYNSYCRSGRIHTYSRSFHSSVRSGYHGSSLSGSSYGGGGGFSHGGGGRGGGGGGGGH